MDCIGGIVQENQVRLLSALIFLLKWKHHFGWLLKLLNRHLSFPFLPCSRILSFPCAWPYDRWAQFKIILIKLLNLSNSSAVSYYLLFHCSVDFLSGLYALLLSFSWKKGAKGEERIVFAPWKRIAFKLYLWSSWYICSLFFNLVASNHRGRMQVHNPSSLVAWHEFFLV